MKSYTFFIVLSFFTSDLFSLGLSMAASSLTLIWNGCDKMVITKGKEATLSCVSTDKTESDFIDISLSNHTSFASITINNKNYPRLKGSLFKNLSISISLNLQRNEIEIIHQETFSDIMFLNILDLSSNKISSLSEIFTSFKNNIYLNSNGVFSSLKKIKITSNRLSKINDFFPKQFENLLILELSSNGLEFITNDSLRYLKNLNQIDLNVNSLTSISNIFNNLSNLTDILIEYNQIKIIGNEDLFGLSKLQNLKIGRNKFLKNVSQYSLQSLVNVESIQFGKDSIEYLEKDIFSRTLKLKKLDLQENSILSLDNGFLIPLKNLTNLSLQNNKIESLRNMSLFGLVSLIDLNLENNQINKIEDWSFSNLNKLTSLNLCQNNISYLTKATFTGLKSLTNLSLKFNRISIEKLETSIFENLEKIVYLDLSFNLIHSIPNNVFGKLNFLTNLNLNNNFLKMIDEKMLVGLYSLINIAVNFNQIISINEETFSMCCKKIKTWSLNSNLIETAWFLFSNVSERVDLSSNLIKMIKKDSLKKLNFVLYLILNDNKIETIETNSFEKFSTMIFLDLSKNKLIEIKNGTFKNNSNLDYLDLSSNSISSLNTQTFKGLKRLTYLNLGNNYLTGLEGNLFYELNILKTIILSFNKIFSISENAFRFDNKVEILILSSNEISNLTFLKGSLHVSNSTLRYIDVSKNHISRIKKNEVNLPNLDKIDLSNNKIEANGIEKNSFKDSNLINFTLNNMNDNAKIAFYFDLVNDFPNNLIELDLSNNRILLLNDKNDSTSVFLNLKKLVLANISETFYLKNILSLCPNVEILDLSKNTLIFKENIPFFSPLVKLAVLKLNEIQIDTLDVIDFSRVNSLTDLNLNGNRVTKIMVNNLKNLNKLERLDLSSNNISFIEDYSFANLSLKYLNLESNKIKSLHYDILRNSNLLAELLLNKNVISLILRFNKQYCKDLKRIDLSFNSLISANLEMSFSDTSMLESLNLANNLITSIKKEDFKFFESLVNLTLSSNKINYTETFKNLEKLERLSLDLNYIFTLDQDTFVGLFRLEFLNLSSNALESIDRYLFKDLYSLKEIDLSNNSIINLGDTSTSNSLSRLESLFLQNNLNLVVGEKSLSGMENIQNIWIDIEVFYDFKNKMNFNKSLIHRQNKNVSYNGNKSILRVYYHSIFVTSKNRNNNFYNDEIDCFLVLFFIRHKIHLNLKTDFEMEKFFESCFKLELIYFSKKDDKYQMIDIS